MDASRSLQVFTKKPKPTARQERDIGVRDVLSVTALKGQIGETSSGLPESHCFSFPGVR